MQGAQVLRNEAYLNIRCNDEGCSATQQMDFLRNLQVRIGFLQIVHHIITHGIFQ